MTIYRNVGGNFDATPTTSPQAVGTATISFSSCERGQLSYVFNDGSGLSGSISLTRLLPNIACAAIGAANTNADYALSGTWFEPATSGQGVIVEINPNTPLLFMAWYTYANDGASIGGVASQRSPAIWTAG